MTKTELNAILKSLGYGSIRYSAGMLPGPVVKRNNKILKGIKLGTKGPFSSSNISFDRIISGMPGFTVSLNTGNLLILSNGVFEVNMFIDECRLYQSLDMDPSYKQVFCTVNVKKLK